MKNSAGDIRLGGQSQAPWWRPDIHADRAPFLAARVRLRAEIRRFFAENGFTEVETGLLQTSPCAETHLHGFATERAFPGGGRENLYLPTSPEFSHKKLLAAGEKRIFELARAFRNREASPVHAPEFTMLEWYRAHEEYDAVITDTLALVRLAGPTLRHRGHAADTAAAPLRITLAEAFDRFAAVDLLSTVAPDGASDRAAFAAAAAASGVALAADDTWSDIFTRVMAERVEPALDPSRLTILYEYPAPEAALARRAPHDGRVAERFELYACGVELANGFGELTDAAEQRLRYEAAMDEKERLYGERYPVDEDFLAALALMPPASGVALGFDRLVMLASGATRIEQVLWTPPL